MPSGKQQQERKTKQFSARSHSRSASYGRNLNKLGRITSIEEIHQRPTLNRSKSTDGTLGRKNRSFTKLSSLQPLTRTRSHQPVHRGTGKAVLELHKEQDSSDDENDGTNKKNDSESEEEVDEFSDDEPAENIPEAPSQVQLSYKAPPQFSHNSVPKNSSFSSEPAEEPVQVDKLQESVENSLKLDPTRIETEASKLNLNDLSEKAGSSSQESKASAQPNQPQDVNQYKESLSQYYQNMILSQSTGAVRAFGDQPFMNSLVHDQIGQGNNKDTLQYIHSNDHISGNFGNMKSTSSSTNSLRQFTIHNLPNTHNSSNESSSAMSFRAKESGSNPGRLDSAAGTPNNFDQFLRTNNSNIETRTQQKLWLQRENSLLDLPSASGNNSNNPQLRRDFERVSREYVNVRRFSNPCVESVKRVSSQVKPLKPQSTGQMNLANTKHIKHVPSNDFQAKLFKLWIEGESPGNRRPNQPNIGFKYQQVPQSQRPPLLQTTSSSFSGMGNSLRSPAAPSTRAVDRASNSPENKRIDLAAIRLPEEHVQKLS